MLRAAALWIVFLGLYLVFASPISTQELIAGVPSAAAITSFALLYRHAEERRMDLRAPWFRIALRALAAIPPDALRVGRALLRSLQGPRYAQTGLAAQQPFLQGNDSAADATRRALVVLGTSLAPNGYVLMMPEGSETMVLHRLVQVPPRPDREWPV